MEGVGLTAFVYDNQVLFALWTIYYSQTALSILPKFNQRSLLHQF
jgi:hypothetical protein